MAEADFIYCADTTKSKSNAGRSRKIKIKPPLCWLPPKISLLLAYARIVLFNSLFRMGGVFPASTKIRPFFFCPAILLLLPRLCFIQQDLFYLELSTTTLRNYFNTKSNVQPVT
ncbi:hypothetical protein CEXT_597451 [Caerostris extrusa]|uniref:Uncharacterized protein n=1 Tax=Caerostris extrusa TaxID=172846 RepID=A0AAV4WFU3_CAEEX|nr:hypothetical protein CEXT_597451 [Caerostris extrusa]